MPLRASTPTPQLLPYVAEMKTKQLTLSGVDVFQPKVSHYVCPNCIIDYEKNEHIKYPCAYRRGRVRPLLEHITLTILRCPKCGTQFLTNQFNGKKKLRWLKRQVKKTF